MDARSDIRRLRSAGSALLVPLLDAAGGVTEVLGVSRDVTGVKLAAGDVAAINAELGGRGSR